MYLKCRWLSCKELACQSRRHRWCGSVPGLGRSLGGGNGNAHQYSCLENFMDREASRTESMGLWRVGHDLVTEHTCTYLKCTCDLGFLCWLSFLIDIHIQTQTHHFPKSVNSGDTRKYYVKIIYYGNSERLYFWGSKIIVDGNCSHEIKRCLLHGRKARTNLDSILKSRDITLPTKVRLKLWFFQQSCMDVRVGLWRRLSAEELMLLNCGVGEDSWESLGLQGDPTSPS